MRRGKKKRLEQFVCLCGEPQGTVEGDIWTVPNPPICPKCGTDNSERIKRHVFGPSESEKAYLDWAYSNEHGHLSQMNGPDAAKLAWDAAIEWVEGQIVSATYIHHNPNFYGQPVKSHFQGVPCSVCDRSQHYCKCLPHFEMPHETHCSRCQEPLRRKKMDKTEPITKLFWVVVTGVPVVKTGVGITNVVFPNESDIKAALNPYLEEHIGKASQVVSVEEVPLEDIKS